MTGFYAALDVSDKTTAVCVIDKAGAVVCESFVETNPLSIGRFLKPYKRTLKTVCQESGTKAPWLHKELVRQKFPMVCLDARLAHGLLSTQRNKTDKNDARSLAQIARNGWSEQTHVKSDEAYRWRMLLTHRRLLKRKAIALDLALRGTLKVFGAELEDHGKAKRLKRMKGGDLLIPLIADASLRAKEAMLKEAKRLEAMVVKIAKADPVCRRFMTVPGVGPETVLTFRAAVDDPTRFKSSRDVAAHFGLTPRRFQSGDMNILGRISKSGDKGVRAALYQAAFIMLVRSKSQCRLRTWGLRLRTNKGTRKAAVAVARKLAVILHRMWLTGRDFDGSPA